MMALIFEIIKITGWSMVIICLFWKKKGMPMITYYLMFISAALMIYSGLSDIVSGVYLTKSMVWLPANIFIIATYIVGVSRYYSTWKELQEKADKFIRKMDSLKNEDINM